MGRAARVGLMDVPRADSRHALIVANEAYEDDTLRQLRAPSRDAEELARVLGDPDIGGFHVEQSTNEPAHLLRRRIARFFDDRRLGDLLVLHISGHGVKDEDGNLYFATSDTETDQLDATAIPAEFLNRRMARSRSKSIVLLLDCCFSGAFARGALARGTATVGVKESFDGQGKIVLTSSNAAEYSFEGTEVEGHGDPSYFTRAVVEGLETGAADADGDQLVSVDELYDYVYEAVRRTSPNQTPCKWTFDVRGEIYLARNRAPVVATTAMLPAPILQALENPIPSVREGVIDDVAGLLGGRDRRMAEAARLALTELLEDDSRRVQKAAEAALGGGEIEELVALAIPVTPDRDTEPPPEPQREPEPEPASEVIVVQESEQPAPVVPEAPSEPGPAPEVVAVQGRETPAPVVSDAPSQPGPAPEVVAMRPPSGAERSRPWPALLAAAGGLGLLVAPFLPVAGSGAGSLVSGPGRPFSVSFWVALEYFGVGVAALAIAALLYRHRLSPLFAGGFLVGAGLQTIVGGYTDARFWQQLGGGPYIAWVWLVAIAAGICALTAGILLLRRQDRSVAPARRASTLGATFAIAGAVIMTLGLLVPVLGGNRILTSSSGSWWLGVEIILAAVVVVGVAARRLTVRDAPRLPATAIALAMGLQSILYFCFFAFAWTTWSGSPGPGAEWGDFVGLVGALTATYGTVRMGALEGVLREP